MDKKNTIAVIEQYLEGFNSGDFSDAKFSTGMKFISPLKPEPVIGNTTIRGFLSDVATRVESVNIRQHIVNYPLASSLFEFKTTNGDVFILIDYFQFEKEEISFNLAVFRSQNINCQSSASAAISYGKELLKKIGFH